MSHSANKTGASGILFVFPFPGRSLGLRGYGGPGRRKRSGAKNGLPKCILVCIKKKGSRARKDQALIPQRLMPGFSLICYILYQGRKGLYLESINSGYHRTSQASLLRQFNKQVSPSLDHSILAHCFNDGSLDLYEGSKDEKSYLIWDDGTAELVSQADVSLILTTMSTPGGKDEGDESLEDQLKKSKLCMSVMSQMVGEETGDHYLKRIHCGKQWCKLCGDRRNTMGKLLVGHIHKRRKKAVFARLNAGYEICDKEDFAVLKGTLSKCTQLQYVFTVPVSQRSLFFSKAGLNRLANAAKRCIEEIHFDKGAMCFIHVVGDTSDQFHPHINVHVYESKNYKVLPEKIGNSRPEDRLLKRIKRHWSRSLIGLGCKLEKDDKGNFCVDVHKSFVTSDKPLRMLHRIKYMTKPIEVSVFDRWRATGNREMLNFAVRELKGFRYIRYWGSLSNSNYRQWFDDVNSDNYTAQEIDEMKKNLKTKEERIVGEKLIKGTVVHMNIERLFANPLLDVEEVSPDFFRVRLKTKYLKVVKNGNG